MASIIEIYQKYRIPPFLQLHQLRVTAVAMTIFELLKKPHSYSALDKNNLLLACLLHDMGNILKFDLNRFPETLEPEGLEYWSGVKADFQKYGKDEKEATLTIARQLSVNQTVLSIINSIGFLSAKKVWENKELLKMIAIYSDMRVAPNSVTSLKNRLDDLAKRYEVKFKSQQSIGLRLEHRAIMVQVEDYLQHLVVQPLSSITELTVQPKINSLKIEDTNLVC